MIERPRFVLGVHSICLLIAIILQAVILLAWAVPFDLPKVNAWQAAAWLMFFISLW